MKLQQTILFTHFFYIYIFVCFSICRYRVLLDSILTNNEAELIDTLKLFIEASKFFEFITNKFSPMHSNRWLFFHEYAWIWTVVNEHVSLVISRQLLTDVGNHLMSLPDHVSKTISHFTLDKVQPRVISFEEQVANIRQHLSQIYEREENWREAANVLVGIPLETGQK